MKASHNATYADIARVQVERIRREARAAGVHNRTPDEVEALLKHAGELYDANASLPAILKATAHDDEALTLIGRYLGVAMSTMRREADAL